MTADFDTLLREALRDLADRAPREAGVRAALARRRARRTGVIAAAVAATMVAVAVPVLRVGGEGGAPPARIPVAQERTWSFPLSPTWLPAGVTEQMRIVTSRPEAENVFVRAWHSGPPDLGKRAALTLTVGGPSGEFEQAEGIPIPDQGLLESVWFYDVSGVVAVTGSYDGTAVELVAPFRLSDRATLERVAAGLRPTSGPPLHVALSLGERDTAPIGVRSAPDGTPIPFLWPEVLGGGEDNILVEYTPIAPDLDRPDLRVTVLGREAYVLTHRPYKETAPTEILAVPVEGRWLLVNNFGVSPDLARVDTLVRVAESVRIGPDPDNPWLGSRV